MISFENKKGDKEMKEATNKNGVWFRKYTTMILLEKAIKNTLYEFRFKDSAQMQEKIGNTLTQITEQDILKFSKENSNKTRLFFY